MTGASGFLGGAVCRALQRAGADVHGSCGRRPLPAGVSGRRVGGRGELGQWVRALRPERVIHLAAPVRLERDLDLYDDLHEGILGLTQEVARACLDVGARLVHVGTCEELAGGPVPFTDDAPPTPTSPYSALKAAASAWVQMLQRSTALDAVVVRPFRAYGPGEARGLVPEAVAAAVAGRPLPLTDGAQIREWNHVDAIAAGLVGLAAHPDARGRTLGLGGGPRASVQQVAGLIFRLAGADPALVQVGALPRRAGEVDRFWSEPTLARALLGPLPDPGLERGLALTVAAAAAPPVAP